MKIQPRLESNPKAAVRNIPNLTMALSLRNVIAIALFAMIFVLAIRQSASLDPDLWWHLKAGEQIVTTRSIPHVDDFSFTKRVPSGSPTSGCRKF